MNPFSGALARRVLNVLLATAAGCALFSPVAFAQTVTLTDTGPIGSGTGPTYYAGDGWQISITSSYPNAGVDMCDPSGCTTGGFYGNTDSGGAFTLTGAFDPADNGSWSETWSVG